MAIIIRVDGTNEEVQPKNGTDFRLEEMQAIVGGYIEVLYGEHNTLMVIDEEGKLKGKPRNEYATAFPELRLFPGDYIAGDVLICKGSEVR